MSSRSYEEAIKCLNGLQSNAATLSNLRKSRSDSNKQSIPEMWAYIDDLGYKASDFDSLNIIHVAGTKGKGSTCAFVESILRHTQRSNFKTGLYTSPHIIEVRERIRINGSPLSREMFAKYFFEIYDIFASSSRAPPPQYFRFLTLMGLHAFKRESVDVAIIEVGIGGEYDCTNVIERPVVCAISSLGLDHQAILGDTIEEIAWQKAGIIKVQDLYDIFSTLTLQNGVPIVSTNQTQGAMDVIRERSASRSAPLSILGDLDPSMTQLGLSGNHQRTNAALAVEVCKLWLERMQKSVLEHELVSIGLKNTRWPGRSQVIRSPCLNGKLCLDGAHTVESIEACVDWFKSIKASESILVFNCTMGRDPSSLLRPLYTLHARDSFRHVIFTTNTLTTRGNGGDLANHMVNYDNQLTTQRELAAAWTMLGAESNNISVCASIEDALEKARNTIANFSDAKVLITGSLHLVGAILSALGEQVS